MLGRKTYTPEEFAHARKAVDEQLTTYRNLADAATTAADPRVSAAVEALEPVLFANLVLALDRFFVHRVRLISGNGSNALNEVELLAESVITGEGVLSASKVLRLKPDQTVLGLAPGDRIRLTADRFEDLARAFFAELETRFSA